MLLVGPGALGTLFAARLGRRFPTLWVLDHLSARAAELQETGFHTKGVSLLDWTPPEGRVRVDLRGCPVMDFVIFFVKACSLEAAAKQAAPAVGRRTALLCLQDGWGVEKVLARRWPARQIVSGFILERAALEGIGRVFHAASGPTVLDKGAPRAPEAAQVLESAGVHVRLEKNLDQERWQRALIGGCVHLLGALADAPSGRLRDETLSPLLDKLLEEGVRLSAALRRPIALAKARRLAEEWIRQNPGKSPFLIDMSRGRPTEREFLLGPLLEAARRRRAPAPTWLFLDRLLTGVEKAHRARRAGVAA
jgi:2-dehydropantoate 2-reductase